MPPSKAEPLVNMVLSGEGQAVLVGVSYGYCLCVWFGCCLSVRLTIMATLFCLYVCVCVCVCVCVLYSMFVCSCVKHYPWTWRMCNYTLVERVSYQLHWWLIVTFDICKFSVDFVLPMSCLVWWYAIKDENFVNFTRVTAKFLCWVCNWVCEVALRGIEPQKNQHCV